MIDEFIQKFDTQREAIKDKIRKKGHPCYVDLVRFVCKAITDDDSRTPDPDRITCIDDGDYQGTLLFVIASGGYQPDTYWAVKVSYGSCSGCDTLQHIQEDGPYDGPITDSQVDQYFTLCLHIIQQMVEIGGDSV